MTTPRLALLLAGGASRRMQRDKAWLEFGGQALLPRRIAALRRHFAACVVATDGRRCGALEGAIVWPDMPPGTGPLPVLLRALERWGEELYLAALDQPDDLDVLASLHEARAQQADALAWLPTSDGVVQPFAALYTAALADPLRAAAEQGERSLRRFLQGRRDVVRVATSARANLNAAADLRRFRQGASDGR